MKAFKNTIFNKRESWHSNLSMIVWKSKFEFLLVIFPSAYCSTSFVFGVFVHHLINSDQFKIFHYFFSYQ